MIERIGIRRTASRRLVSLRYKERHQEGGRATAVDAPAGLSYITGGKPA